MKALRFTCAITVICSLLFISCDKYEQDKNDTTPPNVEVGISVDQQNIPNSKTLWDPKRSYISLKSTDTRNREYEFYVSAQDPGGLTKVVIEVCPKDALVKGSLGPLEVNLDPSKSGSYVKAGKLRPLKLNEKVSIKITVIGKDKNGTKTREASIYAIANKNVKNYKDFRKNVNLCNPSVVVQLTSTGSTNANQTYCSCVRRFGAVTPTTCSKLNNACQKNDFEIFLPLGAKAKWVKNLTGEKGALRTPLWFYNSIPQNYMDLKPDEERPYSGKIIGPWSFSTTQPIRIGLEYVEIGYQY